MANRRMFSRDIMQSDSFVELSAEARLLYVYLNLNADDDGFVENPKGVARLSVCDYTSIEELKTSNFVIECRAGLFVVVHWMLHNYIQSDRKHETRFTKEKSCLSVVNKEYVFSGSCSCIQDGYKEDTNCIRNVSKMEPENSIGEDRGGKDSNSIGKDSNSIGGEEEKAPPAPPSLEEVEAYCRDNGLHMDAEHFFRYFEASGWRDKKGRRVENWRQKALEWEKYERDTANGKRGKYAGVSENKWIEDFRAAEERQKKNRPWGKVGDYSDYHEADKNQVYPWDLQEKNTEGGGEN